MHATKHPQRDVRVRAPEDAPAELAGMQADLRVVDTGGAGLPIVYLHGHGARLEDGEALFDALVARGRRVIAARYDDAPPERLYRGTKELHARMRSSTLIELRTGHSVHAEAPRCLAAHIDELTRA